MSRGVSSPVKTSAHSLAGHFAIVLAVGSLFGGMKPLLAANAVSDRIVEATTPSGAAQKTELSAVAIAERRSAVQKEIAATRAELAKLPEARSDDAARWLAEETALLERIDAIHAEQQRTWQHASDLANEAAEIEESTRNRRPPEATFTPPYNLALLDQLYGERDYLDEATEALKVDVGNAEAAMRDAREVLQEKARERRAVRGTVGAKETAGKAPGNLRLAELESRLAEETMHLREKALRTLKLQQSLLGPKQTLLRPRLDWLRANLMLGPPPSTESQAKRTAELDLAIAAAKEEAEAATQLVIATERRAVIQKITDELESRRASRQTANLTLSVLTSQRERLDEKATVTALRRQVLSGEMSGSELRAVAKDNREVIDQLAAERKRQLTDLIRSRRELQDWQGRLTHAAAADEKSPLWSVDRVKRLTAWIELRQSEMADIDRLRVERTRLQEEISTRVTLFSWGDSTARLRDSLASAWNFEAFSVQDQPVRVKTMLAVLLLVVLGYYGSRWLSEQVSSQVFKRIGMNPGRRAAWQSLWFYALFVVVLVVAFNLFHISLTQFSVASGALAVGIGFGSQNLISNFISGIILLIERPVNQGDVIEIEGRRVTVESLGVRSTIVRTLENTHMVVPNSRLLDQPVINWTLSDEVVRQMISVGVAYGSPTRKVAELLYGVLTGIETVQTTPKPLVKFADFGESSLVFEVFFWATIEERLDTENELRHRIAEVFAKEEIVMAFPQRDVHLAMAKPLHVVVTPAGGNGERISEIVVDAPKVQVKL